jgi:hypothetical protein
MLIIDQTRQPSEDAQLDRLRYAGELTIGINHIGCHELTM